MVGTELLPSEGNKLVVSDDKTLVESVGKDLLLFEGNKLLYIDGDPLILGDIQIVGEECIDHNPLFSGHANHMPPSLHRSSWFNLTSPFVIMTSNLEENGHAMLPVVTSYICSNKCKTWSSYR